jgi:Leucine-rich repeat (LRR) protein
LFSLVYLGTINNEFTNFPKDLKNFSGLMYLELIGTKIDSIPAEIAYLQRLKTFQFSGKDDSLKITNKLKFIKSLNELIIESVKLDSCPGTVFRIPSLKRLSLVNCGIQAIPDNLEKLVGMEVLILDFNKISVLPRNIYLCKQLNYLSLKNNQLKKIPDTICQLKNLTKLDLRGNAISKDDLEEIKALLPGCQVLF